MDLFLPIKMSLLSRLRNIEGIWIPNNLNDLSNGYIPNYV